ncbi:carboxymuconolactone decarboxylase family domain protein [Escherichia coli 3-105-05_S4_C3]|nr:carboxymuconolactone decarboxylase family domain protein [Escherichia coli 3-105-05_S4_C3]
MASFVNHYTKTRAENPRQKPDYGQRINRILTERADWLSPQ